MVDITAISAAYNALKFGKEVLSTLDKPNIAIGSRSRIREAFEKLGEAQTTIYEMRDEIFRLQSDNEKLRREQVLANTWSDKIAKYELTATAGGAVVFKSRGNPEHFACPSCADSQKLEILQDNRTMSGKYRCIGCKGEFPIKPQANPPSNHRGGSDGSWPG